MQIKFVVASWIGLVLGIVWLIIGFSYDNSALIMFGSIVLSMGIFFKLLKVPNKDKVTHKIPSQKKHQNEKAA